ncbi:MAG: DUF4249 domain-containing protein [Gemmatimonadaceae bacterium]|nr:DUF4249 domain-containing protein [Gemmatimonadaceae bacterium]
MTTALAVAVLSACERVVSVTVPVAEVRLVVEARLERARGAVAADQVIRLTTTEGVFSSSGTPPAATGATVRVVAADGAITPFTERAGEPGVFVARAMPLVVAAPYTLEITWDGDRYAATETMQPAVTLDSLYFTVGNARPGRPSGLAASIRLLDPAGERNFYLWDQWVNGRRQVSPDSTTFTRAVLSDDILDGAVITDFTPYGGIILQPTEVVRLRQLSISEQAYRFYAALSAQTGNDGSPFAVPAGSVRGNVANVTRPGRLALGYFIAGEYTEREARVGGLLSSGEP